jgi:glycerophosphoryl diester phosphodiesterase
MINIVAHRGNASHFPENSIEAIESACTLGAKFIEIDIQFSLDYIPFVIHDPDLQRTFGDIREVSKTLSSELTSVGVPTLYEITKILSNYPDVLLFIEIKSESIDVHLANNGNDWINVLFQNMVKTFEYSNQYVVIGFDDDIIYAYQNAYPWYDAGWCLPQYNDLCIKRLKYLNCAYAFVDYKDLDDSSIVNDRHYWVAYEVPSKEIGDRLIAQGFTHLETMHVEDMLKYYK